MGTALHSVGHSNGAANICGSAHGTADSGKAERGTDDSGNGRVMSNPGAGSGTRAVIEGFVTNYCPYNTRGRDTGSTAASTTGADAVGDVNNHTVVGAVEYGAPHDTGHDVGVAHGNNNRKVDDTDTGGAPETTRCHEADGTNKAFSTTPSTVGISEAHSGSAERDKIEADRRNS